MLQLDDQIGKLIDQIKDHAKKRDFLADFYKEPISALLSLSLPPPLVLHLLCLLDRPLPSRAAAMNKLVQDQVLDYKLMTGATDTEASLPEDERHADYYYQVPSPSQQQQQQQQQQNTHTHTHAHTTTTHTTHSHTACLQPFTLKAVEKYLQRP
jgi:hypothetical protein